MDTYTNIEKKLHQFVRKYYVNELIKGSILFLSLGLLYFFFTLFIEYFLWLQPTPRTILFWLFVLVETYLLFRFILTPIFKLIGIKKGISHTESSKIIGNHFPKVGDKLINVLQLKATDQQSDLLLASIEQKSKELQPVPFVQAINFKTNIKYLKYAAIPVFIWLLILITGNSIVFNTSLKRVVNYNTAYQPPAPFIFKLKNKNLKVVQGKPFTIKFITLGKVTPFDVKVFYKNQSYFLQNNNNEFSYTFTDTQKEILFYVEANGITSEQYQLEIIQTPTIQNISIDAKFPNYLQKKKQKIENAGAVLVPEGTQLTWNIATQQTDSLSFRSNKTTTFFSKQSEGVFSYKTVAKQSFSYQIASSNSQLKDFEKLFFKVDVIKDEFPKIEVLSEIDSLQHTAQFVGNISDDYGIKKLLAVYYDINNPSKIQTKKIQLTTQENQSFYFAFPGKLELKKGVDYEIYFQVFDNDGVNGSKHSTSKKFNFRNKSIDEIEADAVQQQKNQIKSIENNLLKRKQQKSELKEIQHNLQNNKNINWSYKKKLDNYLKRQAQYKQMMQQQTNKLKENIKDLPSDNKTIQQKKEQLKKRIEELKKLEKEQKILDELKKLSEKLNKEALLKRIKKLAEQNKQQERSLERILELTKRFYIEQKTLQIANKLKKLSKDQDSLSKQQQTNLNAQKKIQEQFKKVQKELDELKKDNSKLKQPMQLPDTKKEQEEITKELKKASQNNQSESRSQQQKSQKKASQKMQQMSDKMQQSMMAMNGEMKEANIKSLRIILENLLNFSFQQEDLMKRFYKLTSSHPNFGKELKHQNVLKTYFEHIDDSLYVLSMKMPEVSVVIQKDLTNIHYNINQSLENFAESRFGNGTSNQQYVMTSVNNIADFLSNILDNMQQPKMSNPGKGKKGGKSFSLPDIIKKQQDIVKKMQQGTKKSQQKGKKNNGNDRNNLDKDLYQTYQEQAKLRQELQELMQKTKNSNNPAAKKILKSMEQLENEMLEKGFNPQTIQKMQQLQYNLLKLDKAAFEQDKDTKRKATTNQQKHNPKQVQLLLKKLFYNQTEILNRQSLPLQKIYKKKVQEYFKNTKQQ